jgi:hypothetical protein
MPETTSRSLGDLVRQVVQVEVGQRLVLVLAHEVFGVPGGHVVRSESDSG